MRLLVLFSIWIAVGCTSNEEKKGPPAYFGPRDQIFYASFEEVWRASNLALQPYPLKVSNMDQGTLETDSIRGFKIWTPPYKMQGPSGGHAYKLTVKIIRGSSHGKAAAKVAILKDMTLQNDFFSDPRPLPSDGLEEKMLLYRIGREIQTERALTKSQKKHNSQTN